MPDTSKDYAKLAAEIEFHRNRIIEYERDIFEHKQRINAIIDNAPDTFRKKYRICNMCQEWTLERWSARRHIGCTCCLPQCASHTKSKDEVSLAILAEVFRGDI